MKHLKTLGLVTAAAMSLMALAVSSASATTVELGGVTKNESMELAGSLQKETSGVLSRTDGTIANTCTGATASGVTESPFTGTTLSGSVKEWAGTGCSGSVTVHKVGTFKVAHIASSTNGTVTSSGAEVTTSSPFGTLNCKTGESTDVGVLTGVSSGHATVDINAVINCGFLAPSSTLKATLVVTSPTAVGIVS